MNFKNDYDLINDFHFKSGHSDSSKKSYMTVFNNYRNFHDMSLCDLLHEAISEQEDRIPNNKLSVYDRIISFRNYLKENYLANTITNAISKIKTFYLYNRVDVPFIPPLNNKWVRKNEIISFDDLPTKDELKLAMKFADDELKMWIMVMISSGSTRAEVKTITNRMFFEGTRDYHQKDDFEDALKYLSRKNNIVCTCKLIRQKTDKPYITFLTPECVQKIAKIKLKQENFDLNKPLLKYELNHVNYKFKQLNDYLGFGEVGGYAKLRPHMLRKFNATYLTQGGLDGDVLNMDLVDELHGRGKDQTRQTYYKDNPEYLKLEYIRAMSNISLYRKYGYEIVNGKVKVISMPL